MDDSHATVRQASRQRDAGGQTAGRTRSATWTTVGGVLAAIGVCASCCLLPFALAGLGVGSAWLGSLKSFVHYKQIFVVAAAGVLAYGFYAVYWRPTEGCSGGARCISCQPNRSARLGLWVATILAASSVLFEYVEPYLSGL